MPINYSLFLFNKLPDIPNRFSQILFFICIVFLFLFVIYYFSKFYNYNKIYLTEKFNFYSITRETKFQIKQKIIKIKQINYNNMNNNE